MQSRSYIYYFLAPFHHYHAFFKPYDVFSIISMVINLSFSEPIVDLVPDAPPSMLVLPAQNAIVPNSNSLISPRNQPARIASLAGTNASFLIPDHIQEKFDDGWNVHVP
jgi:hypothetical protein